MINGDVCVHVCVCLHVVLTPYALTTPPLPPLLLTVLYSGFINKFLSLIRSIVDTVKIIDLC